MTTSRTTEFAAITDAIEDIRAGRMVVILDSEDRENEGDLVMAAQFATPEAINFMATHGRGLICLALTEARCDQLGLKGPGYRVYLEVDVTAKYVERLLAWNTAVEDGPT